MKKTLLALSLLLGIVACQKQVELPHSLNAVEFHHLWLIQDDFSIEDVFIEPDDGFCDSGVTRDVFKADSTYNPLSGKIYYIRFHFSNTNMDFTQIHVYKDGSQIDALYLDGNNDAIFTSTLGYTWPGGFHSLKLRAKPHGTSGQRFHVTLDSVSFGDPNGNLQPTNGIPCQGGTLIIN